VIKWVILSILLGITLVFPGCERTYRQRLAVYENNALQKEFVVVMDGKTQCFDEFVVEMNCERRDSFLQAVIGITDSHQPGNTHWFFRVFDGSPKKQGTAWVREKKIVLLESME
jgi:hypothetical protein